MHCNYKPPPQPSIDVAPKKRILIVCQHFWPEQFRINDIADYLVNRNCDVEVLCGIPNYPTGKYYPGYSPFTNKIQDHNGLKIYRAFEYPRGNNRYVSIFLNYISFPLATLFHIPRLLRTKYDLILLYSLSPVIMSLSGIIVGKLLHIKTTMYVLDLWPDNLFAVVPIKSGFTRALLTRVSHWHYKNADKIITLTNTMREKLLSVTGKHEDAIIVLPQAAEQLYEQNIRDSDLCIKFGQGFNVLIAGNISPAQSLDTVVKAARKIRESGITDIYWIIVGDGMSKDWLENQVKKQGLHEYFFFEGHKPIADIPKYTYIADVLLGCLAKSPLLEATVPAKVLSYIAAGKPIVLAMDGEAQALINTEIRCGFAGPSEDADTLAANIMRVYSMPTEERDTLGNLAKAYHFSNLQRDMVLDRLYDFLIK
jgi:colanic acid biosynthesis glycosyl transferase WcaI